VGIEADRKVPVGRSSDTLSLIFFHDSSTYRHIHLEIKIVARPTGARARCRHPRSWVSTRPTASRYVPPSTPFPRPRSRKPSKLTQSHAYVSLGGSHFSSHRLPRSRFRRHLSWRSRIPTPSHTTGGQEVYGSCQTRHTASRRCRVCHGGTERRGLSYLLNHSDKELTQGMHAQPILVPPRPLPQPPFSAVPIPTSSGAQQQLYHVVDDEIDFASYLKQPLPPGLANSAGVKWRAHWLAVEGVQPAIPENPTPGSRAGRA